MNTAGFHAGVHAVAFPGGQKSKFVSPQVGEKEHCIMEAGTQG